MKNIVTNATLWFLLSFISAACLVSLNYPNISPREKYLSDYLNQQDFFVLFMGGKHHNDGVVDWNIYDKKYKYNYT